MPTLADIYSYIDTQKRKAAGAIRSPLSTLQEMAALAGDEARQINRETALSSQGRRQEMVGQPMSPEQEAARLALVERAGEAALGGMTNSINEVLLTKYPKVALDISESPKAIDLSRIVVPKELRNQGVGSNVMQDLINYADETGKQIRLSPSSDFGGSPTRLKKFYKQFGFVENKGRNKDFSTRETMIRQPATSEN